MTAIKPLGSPPKHLSKEQLRYWQEIARTVPHLRHTDRLFLSQLVLGMDKADRVNRMAQDAPPGPNRLKATELWFRIHQQNMRDLQSLAGKPGDRIHEESLKAPASPTEAATRKLGIPV